MVRRHLIKFRSLEMTAAGDWLRLEGMVDLWSIAQDKA